MSYDICLTCPITGETLESEQPHSMTGGTYCVGGTKDLTLNITYNYSRIFNSVFGDKGIRAIYGKTGAESLPLLNGAIKTLKNDVSSNYWEATEGNVAVALAKLRALAQMRPDGVWSGD